MAGAQSVTLPGASDITIAWLARRILGLVWGEPMPIGPDILDKGLPDRGFLERIYREERSRIVATLIRLVGSFELAEEATQEAFAAALEQWPREGAPANPRAWLISTARHKAIDAVRRKARWEDGRDPDADFECAGGRAGVRR